MSFERVGITEGPGPRIAFGESGEGPPLILLHGMGGSRESWAPQVAAFARHFRVIAWDARGCGQSEDPPDDFAFTDFGDDVRRLLDRLRVPRAHLCGLSMGGRIVLESYRQNPDRVLSMTLSSCNASLAHTDPESRERFISERRGPLMAGQTMRELAAGLIPRLLSPGATQAARETLADEIASVDKLNYLRLLSATVRHELVPDLAAVDVPALVLAASEDPLAKPESMRRMAGAIPGAKFTLLGGAGHCSNLEQPEAYTKAVLDFLLALPVSSLA